MKRVLTALMLVSVAMMAMAADNTKQGLDKVFLSVSAKQWVKTETALLEVSVSATLNNADMVKTRSQIMTQLQSIAQGEWHITQFDRSQDSSGLEKLNVSAQARVQQSALNQVYEKAKSVSKPGIAYRISQIDFKPGLTDIEKGKVALREKLYQQVIAEIKLLNKEYPQQNYSLNRLIFNESGQDMPTPMAKRVRSDAMILTAIAQAPAISVSNEITMKALVVLASNRPQNNKSNND